MTDYKKLEQRYEFDVFPKRDLVLVKGKNARVWDDKGREYIDCVGGHGVANIGHCNPAVVEAVKKQAGEMITCPGIFYNDTRALLLEQLQAISPAGLNRSFLCNSGTEAAEAALKFARYTTGKTDFVCAMRGFHGRTMGAMSATFNPKYKNEFQPGVPGFHFVPFNNFEKLAAKINDQTAAVLLEVVQGEGGVNIGNTGYFEKVQRLCRERDILLIIDEVQTGFCRTGLMFASEHFNLQPDMLCVAKAIAGGIPMGAVLCSDKVKVPAGKHGTTFGGNPLACAAANAAIQFMLDHNLAEVAEQKGAYFIDKLGRSFSEKVREVRQIGLMIGIELKEKSQPYIVKLMEQGVLTLPAGATVIRLLPPLTIGYDVLDEVILKLNIVLN